MKKNVLKTKNHASIRRKIFTKIITTLAFILLSNTMFSQAGAALSFDGANDYVQMGNIMPATYTKEAWFYVSNLGLQNNLISGGSDGQHALYPSTTYGNRLSAGHNGTWNAVQDPTPIVVNTWYHVALTYDVATTTMKLYKNGILVSTNTSVPPFIGGSALRLGSYDAASNQLGGKLDEVRIWNRVLPQCEIQYNMNGELPSGQVGLVAYYKFNQGIALANNAAITTLTDFSGNANTGTLTNFALTGATSNWVTPGGVTTGTMSPAPLSVTSPQVFCTGSTVANLTATGTTIKWYNVATGGTALVSTTALATGTYYVTQTTGTCESPRTAVIVTVNTTAIPTATSPQAFNTGSTVANLIATGTALKWYAVSTGGAALVSTTPLVTGLYYVSQTISGCESLRRSVQVNINGAGLDFDGVNDQVSFGNAITTVLSGTNKLTVEGWVKTTNTTGIKTVICNHGSGLPTQFDLRTNGTNFNCFVGFGTYVVTGGTVIPNTWQHVAMVFDGVTLKLYVNGVNVGTTNTPSYTLPASTAPIIMGNNGYGEIFQGKMDEVRVWNRALPQAEIQNNLNCELGAGQTGLVAYYKFNQGIDNASNTTITTLTDSSGNTNTGTLSNFTLTGTTSNWTGTGGVTTGNTCSTYLAVNDFEFSSKLSVYPNPSSNVFSINSETRGNIVVYDLIGKIIKSENLDLGITKLNLSNYPSGLYLMKVTNDSNQTKMMKLIKQ
ncbi:Por secretion system C-terminal sorting domain-containing protein [Flavobacterium swingsii]|uniref:Por secretion system C-terminal sorting domain-containing protein n=1 Tax=Flavobacterium swingsii TaxID=498292 RepID=A0A1I0V9K9_9FLAO|nr:LamG-like jellyroll fold domain-containing protein [Flavobacterium swingsii]SFA72958.1 Por secretion system C-terminal sorting domain-containing protein [Flavobacterium swingsii]